MFISHWSVGLAAKRVAPRASLGTLLLASQWVDLIWPTFLFLGWETVRIAPGNTVVMPLDFASYPYTHSLLAGVCWGLLLGGAVFAMRRSARSALVVAALVVSHWFLDLVVHRPDLALVPGGAKYGLSLWNRPIVTLVTEFGLLALGALIYSRVTRARDRAGSIGFVALVGLIALVFLMNFLGPPPPNIATLVWVGHAQWLVVLWGYWLDRHRELVT